MAEKRPEIKSYLKKVADLEPPRMPVKSEYDMLVGFDKGQKAAEEKKLATEQRQLARKKKHSANWKKQKRKITRLHIRIADARNDYLHKSSTTISKKTTR